MAAYKSIPIPLVALVTVACSGGQPSGAVPSEPMPIQAGVAPTPGPYAPGVDVLHYDVEVGLSRSESWVGGRTSILARALTDAPSLPLDLTGLAVESVSVDGAPGTGLYENGVLRIELPGRHEGDTVHVRVDYRGTPDDGLILKENVHGNATAFADNWPNRARFWFPSVDHPSDKATVTFTVHAPVEWRVIANGRPVGEPEPTPAGSPGPAGDRLTWRWEVGVPIPTYTMVVGAADFAVLDGGLAACGRAPASPREDGCVQVESWVFPEDVENAGRIFARSALMVDYFSDLVGPFPYEKLVNVQSSTRFGGMENASAIFYTEEGIAEGRDMEGTVSHEIAHQWFGDAVTETDWHHLWLSEGFATYFGILFFENADGEVRFRELMEGRRQDYLASRVVDRPVVDPEERDLFALLNANNYPKGGWVLHMLRGVMGDEAFFRGIRDYYRTFLHGNALTEDFQRTMEASHGESLDWFFGQWIHQAGYPIYRVEHTWTPTPTGSGGAVEVTVRQIQKAAWPRFRMPMDVLVSTGKGSVRRRVWVTDETTAFTVELEDAPLEVVLDPDGWVLKGDGR